MKRLRAGIIGLGVGEQHIAGYQSHVGCEVVALCDLSDEKIEATQSKYPGLKYSRHADDILLDPEVDIVSIASYDDAHFKQVIKALDSGKHVFVEKPLCQTLDELGAIKQAWARHKGKLKLASNLVLRAAPLYRWLRQRLAAGDFGEVYAFDGDYLYGRLHKITQGWRRDVEGYSVMEGGGIHLIDLMIWLTGQRPTSVSAIGNRVCTKNTPFRYDDYVAASMQFPSGLIGRVSANFGCVHRHQHVVRVFGMGATFIYDDAGPRLHTTRDPSVTASPITVASLPATKGDLIPSFISAILADQDMDLETQTFFDGISISAACDKALRSHSIAEVEYI